MANNGIYYSSGNSLNFTTNNTTWSTLTSGGTFQMSAVSATTYDNLPGSSSANCFTTFFVTNISGCSPVNVLSPLNVKDGLSVTGTSTFTSQANFTGGLSANTFSANTYQNLPSFNSVQINGTTQFLGDTNNFINFSGINITITSAATNTLVFSAGTGGGGGGISGGGTTNYIPKFTGLTGIGNSQLQDDGSQVFTNQGYGSTLTGNLSINASGTTGIAGRATQYGVYGIISGTTAGASAIYGEAGKSQYGVYGLNQGDEAGEYIGVYGRSQQSDSGTAGTVYIGGKFYGDNGTGGGYSVQLQDGTEGVAKVLVSQTSDGKANWNTFSGINITITSAATNTLVFSAATGGGGGGVTSVTAGSGIDINQSTGNVIITNGIGVAMLTSDRTTNISGLTSIDDLSFSVISGSTYRFRFVIHYEALNTSTGSRFTISGAATSILSYRSMYSLGTGTQTLNPALSAYDSPAIHNFNSSATAGNIAIVEGILRPSENGSVVARFASEAQVPSAFIRAKVGSYVEYQKIN